MTATSSPPRTTSTLVVSEIFGPTIQGEGPATGRRASFVRLGGCNLSCSWCDTPYTWDARRFKLREQMTRWPVTEIAAEVARHDTGLVVISGGEPLMQRDKGLTDLVRLITMTGVVVHVETNGTLSPGLLSRHVQLFTVSPKLAHAGQRPERALVPEVLTEFAGIAHQSGAILKIVCRTEDDVSAAAMLADAHHFARSDVWIMPEGTAPAVILARQRALVDVTLAAGMNLTTRLHVLLWKDKRGH